MAFSIKFKQRIMLVRVYTNFVLLDILSITNVHVSAWYWTKVVVMSMSRAILRSKQVCLQLTEPNVLRNCFQTSVRLEHSQYDDNHNKSKGRNCFICLSLNGKQHWLWISQSCDHNYLMWRLTKAITALGMDWKCTAKINSIKVCKC